MTSGVQSAPPKTQGGQGTLAARKTLKNAAHRKQVEKDASHCKGPLKDKAGTILLSF